MIGIVSGQSRPLLGSIALLAPALAMGNPVALVPSETAPLSVTDLYKVIETSDVPPGVINIVTDASASLAANPWPSVDGIDAMWFIGDAATSTAVEKVSIGNLNADLDLRAASPTTSPTRQSSRATTSCAARRR